MTNQQAIEILEGLAVPIHAEAAFDMAIKALTEQSERKKGKWIDICGNLRCSECNIEYSDLYPDYDKTNFCPNCGADMRGDESDESGSD